VLLRKLALLTILSTAPVLPQEGNQSADRSGAAVDSTKAHASNEGLLDRILDLAGPADPKPLTRRQAFNNYLMATAGPLPILGEAAGAGIGQWMNSPKEWGQGWNAYGKRFGANVAYNATRQTIIYGTSSIFHEDTRYFASRADGIWPRAKHALLSTFTARHPDGRDRFSVSSVAGVAGACALSSTWGPDSWQGPKNIARNAGVSFASTAGFNVVREFLPDIFRRPRKK